MSSSSRKNQRRAENTASEALARILLILIQKLRAGAEPPFQSWLYLNAVATSVVASHEQDYDAFASRLA